MKKNELLLNVVSKGLVLFNGLIILLVVNSVNVTCSWIWGQPETPKELKDEFRKF
ncbi:cyclic lactone autoinducer peptide [Enterococcus larvae]|uniref:cyclic lactone autoinducer peptide n=1 Tax=Enterococcus larvae TaxID=2794352 RepID=UPI003F327798